ncbi:hypothetical protein [Xanthomonas citri]|uniref:hypothetical protein n=1 Tax=Xanthomonas citri TaxID=346 RepID=UPI0012373A7A|nr:hypothetical protein [Xanthomonas citri]
MTTEVGSRSDGEDEKPAVEQLFAMLHRSSTHKGLRLLRGSVPFLEAARAAEQPALRALRQHWEPNSALELAARLGSTDALAPVRSSIRHEALAGVPVDALAVASSAQNLVSASNEAVALLRQAAKVWTPALEGLSVGIHQLARGAEVWQSRLSVVGELTIGLQRRVDAATGPARLVVEGIRDRLHVVHDLVQSPTFQEWVNELTSERVQERICRLLEEAEEAERLDHPAATPSDTVSAAKVSNTWILGWLLSIFQRLKEIGIAPAEHRWAFYAIALPLLMSIYLEQGNDEDHAELVSLMRQQHQAEMAQSAKGSQSSAEIAQAMRAVLALQLLEQSFEVTVNSAPVRDELSGSVTRYLVKGDEVQILASAGKWRHVQSVDEEGRLLNGWVLKKHLRRVASEP